MTSLTRRPWFIATASVVALAVGVGAYVVAAPFAQPAHRAPELLEAWTVEPNDGLSPLDATVESETVDSATAPPNSVVAESDGGAAVTIETAMVEHLAAADARILTGEADLTLPSITRSALGIGVTDPCAIVGASDPECPDGARATVLDTGWESDLQLRSSYRSLCGVPPGTLQPLNTAVFEVFSTLPVNLTITYHVNDETRQQTVATTGEAREEWEASDSAEWISHCITLPDLVNGWSDTVLIEGVDDFSSHAEIESFISIRSADIIPPSWVEPITPAAVMISVPAMDVSSFRFVAFAVPFGQEAAACDFDDESDLPIQPVAVVDEGLSTAELDARNYDRRYFERHSAAFIVPEGSTISVCAGWVDDHFWSTTVPDHVFSEVLHSPDYAMPVVTIDDVQIPTGNPWSGVRIRSAVGFLDTDCGDWNFAIIYTDYPLCDYQTLADRSIYWDAAVIIEAKVTAFGSSGARHYVLPVAPQRCGVGCVLPATQYFDIPLESQSNPCLGNGCAQSHVGTARLKVEWVEGNDSWADSWTRAGAARPGAAAPVLDRRAIVTLGAMSADGQSQSAQVRIAADRESSMHLIVNRSRTGIAVERVVDDATFVATRTVQLPDLPAGQDYAITVELTDREGHTSIYSAKPYLEAAYEEPWTTYRPWVGGAFQTDPINLDTDVTVSLSTSDGSAFLYGNYSVQIGSTVWSTTGGGYGRWTCGEGVQTLELSESTTLTSLRQSNSVAVSVEFRLPRLVGGEAPGCASSAAGEAEVLRATTPLIAYARVSLADVRAGATVTTSVEGLIVQIRMAPSAP